MPELFGEDPMIVAKKADVGRLIHRRDEGPLTGVITQVDENDVPLRLRTTEPDCRSAGSQTARKTPNGADSEGSRHARASIISLRAERTTLKAKPS